MSQALISKSTIIPDQKSTGDLKLSVSDLPMLSCHYIQKGGLFTHRPFPIAELIALLKRGLSQTLSHFPPLAGHFKTDADLCIYITCNDTDVEFVDANADGVFTQKPILAVRVTELTEGLFIDCTVNHAITALLVVLPHIPNLYRCSSSDIFAESPRKIIK
ncbi:hypothetical protein RJ640_014193 [Escallonia rubra]|uniref:Uncharacterized protein n=1 Tax=Escallonia rubra TaxID=112253 RepID=A0AA88QWK8_9ASTE|nr:hypothetical protein RJ640_014193 [Escallonia rubra]